MTYRIFALLCLLMFSINALAQPVTVNNINYQLMHNGAMVVAGKYEGHITVPEAITYQDKQYTVDQIGNYAFNESPKLISVKLPRTIQTVGRKAFGNCKALKEISIPASVSRIDEAAFFRCIKLESIYIPENVAFIGEYAFSRCQNLTSIEVDKNNQHFTSLDGILYDKEMSILIKLPDTRTSYEFPSSVTSIVTGSFEGNKNITAVNLPDAVNSIPIHAFLDCSSLKVFHIPANVEFIGSSAFNGCDAMEAFIVDESNQHFASVDGILYNYDKTILIKCPETKSEVTIEKSVKEIKSWAFFRCKKLTEITLPENVTKIESPAFVQCNTLKTLKILSKKHVNIIDALFPGRTKDVTVLVHEELIPGYKTSNRLAVKELNYQALR